MAANGATDGVAARRAARARPALAALLALVTAAPAPAASRPATSFPHEAIACVEPLACEAGAALLAEGGTAADATVGAALVLVVAHPQAGNLLGGSFTMWRAADGRAEFIDGRETAPAALSPGQPPVGVPRAAAALALLHERHGRLPWARVVAPAVRLARQGFEVTPLLARHLVSHGRRLSEDAEAASLFFPEGAPLAAGTRLRQPRLAETLATLRDAGAAALRSGPIVDRLLEDAARRGYALAASDFAGAGAVVRAPLVVDHREYRLLVPPLPSAGGVFLAQALRALAPLRAGPDDRGGSELLHAIARVSRLAWADRRAWLGDPDFVAVPLERLLAEDRLRAWSDALHSTAPLDTAPGTTSGTRDPTHAEGQTTHISVVDRFGNAAAHTTTLNNLFGIGAMARGTGLIWNDELSDFDPPGREAAPNAPAAGKRPLSSMTPVIAERHGRLAFVLGSPGGSTIPSTVLQVVLGLIDLGLEPQAAVDAPRLHVTDEAMVLEPGGVPPDVRRGLERRGEQVVERRDPEPMQGDVHLIAIGPGGARLAAADPRRAGCVRGR